MRQHPFIQASVKTFESYEEFLDRISFRDIFSKEALSDITLLMQEYNSLKRDWEEKSEKMAKSALEEAILSKLESEYLDALKQSELRSSYEQAISDTKRQINTLTETASNVGINNLQLQLEWFQMQLNQVHSLSKAEQQSIRFIQFIHEGGLPQGGGISNPYWVIDMFLNGKIGIDNILEFKDEEVRNACQKIAIDQVLSDQAGIIEDFSEGRFQELQDVLIKIITGEIHLSRLGFEK